MSKLLILNAGSSSLKFKVYGLAAAAAAAGAAGAGAAAADAATGGQASSLATLATGLLERIGDPDKSRMRAAAGAGSWRKGDTLDAPLPDHRAALRLLDGWLGQVFPEFHKDVHSVAHRVVHGGLHLTAPALISEQVRQEIEEACALAPLHNPANLHGIDAGMATFPNVPHVAVFDTAFHATLAPEAYTYALPLELCQRLGIRRYGFHGISYHYLTKAAARMLGRAQDDVNLILCHLGAGSSMCAVQGGRSVDTTMGFTPLEGLMMGSRCGDIDPAIISYLVDHGMELGEVCELLNFRSGFLGLAGDVDVRTVEEQAAAGDERSSLALAVYVRRLRKYLGAYLVHLGGKVDAIVFSAGIGENGDLIRSLACSELGWAGVALDEGANRATVREVAGEIQAPGSRVKVLVIPTDEQLEIAQQALQLLGQGRAPAAAA